MLKAIDIHKSYDKLTILKGVSLEIKKGEIVSIVGASGAGKSTLLNILGTLDDSDQGHIEINNVKIESKTKYDLIPANWQSRLANYFIDRLAITILTSLFIAIFIRIIPESQDEFNDQGAVSFIAPEVSYMLLLCSSLLCSFIYYMVFEGITGRTLGKLITGTKVIVKNDGIRPNLFKIFGRTIARFIPFEAITFIARKPEGWHDSIASTLVIYNDFKYQQPTKKSLTDDELSKFRNKNIGMIFQFHNLLPEFTAIENVCIPAFLSGKPSEEVKARAKELLELLGLGHRIDHKPSELSGGEQQRVAIARALINNPVIVFADEPSGNLDSHNAEELHKLFFKLRDTLNQTFVIVTHNERLANMADRKLEMRDGTII